MGGTLETQEKVHGIKSERQTWKGEGQRQRNEAELKVEMVRKEGGREEREGGRERQRERHVGGEREESSQRQREWCRKREVEAGRETGSGRRQTQQERTGGQESREPILSPRVPKQPHPGLEQGEPPIPPAGCSARTFVLAPPSHSHPSRAGEPHTPPWG